MTSPLDELDALEPAEATAVLTQAASLVLPSPEAGSSKNTDERARVVVERLREFVSRRAPKAKIEAEVSNLLTERLMRPYLTEQKLPDIKARLNGRGLLPERKLKLFYNPTYDDTNKLLQVRHKHIEEAIFSPDAVQRLTPETFGLEKDQVSRMSLFVKHVTPEGKPPFSLLVHCIHQADLLIIGNAWRIYPEDIGSPEDASPLSLLQAFVQTYGMPFSFENSGWERFITFRRFILDTGQKHFRYEIEGGAQVAWAQSVFYRFDSSNAVEVFFAFVINLETYAADLKKRGFSIDFKALEARRLGLASGPFQSGGELYLNPRL